jgi:hypothetical protein
MKMILLTAGQIGAAVGHGFLGRNNATQIHTNINGNTATVNQVVYNITGEEQHIFGMIWSGGATVLYKNNARLRGYSFGGYVDDVMADRVSEINDYFNNNIKGTFSYTSLGPELVINGGFDTDANWELYSFAISDGKAVGTPNEWESALWQEIGLVFDKTYRVTYTINDYISGSCHCVAGDVQGIYRSENGTFTEDLTLNIYTATNGGIVGDVDFAGSIDNISYREIINN